MRGDQGNWYYEVAERVMQAAGKLREDPLQVETAIVILGVAAAFTGTMYLCGKVIEKVRSIVKLG